jgi:O-acetyl-ADP-ribose deacetylase (regulator of RNase III)
MPIYPKSWIPALTAEEAIALAIAQGILPKLDSIPNQAARVQRIAYHLANVLEPMERILLPVIGRTLPVRADRTDRLDDRLLAAIFTDRRVIKFAEREPELVAIGCDYAIESIYLAGIMRVAARENIVDIDCLLAYRSTRVELLALDAGRMFQDAYVWCRTQTDSLGMNVRSSLPPLGVSRHVGLYPLHLRTRPIYQGDILNMPYQLIPDFIVQQVNCKGVMGAGLARQIRNRWPVVKEEYVSFCRGRKQLLGQMLPIQTYPGGPVICNCFGQDGYGSGRNYTDYQALKDTLEKVRELAFETTQNMPRLKDHINIAIPYGIGCGLAGGDWNTVFEIINTVFRECDENSIRTFICQLN